MSGVIYLYTKLLMYLFEPNLETFDTTENKISAIRSADNIFVNDPNIVDNKGVKLKWQMQHQQILK